MIQLTPEAKAKLAPAWAEAKEGWKPFAHALGYCLVVIGWVITLPFTVAGKFLGGYSEKIKPELPQKSEP